MLRNNNAYNLIKKSIVVVVSILLVLALMSTSFYATSIYALDDNEQVTEETTDTDESSEEASESSKEETVDKDKEKAKKTKPAADTKESLDKIKAGSAVIYSASTSQVVYALHEDRKLKPGNLTKLMTAMIVIDNMHNTKEYKAKIDITADAKEKDENLPKAGSTMKLEELLEYMLLTGSDAAAELLTKYSASSTEVFVSEMNSKANSIGLMNSQFANPTGAHSEEMYSSAYDCAVIAQYALRYEKIRTILSESKNDIGFTDLTASMQGETSDPDAVQYVGVSSRKGMELVVVMLDADKKTRAKEAKRLFQYGYKHVNMSPLFKQGKKVGVAKVKHGDRTRVNAYTKTRGYAYVPPEGSSDLVQTQVVMYDTLVAPLPKGTKVGEYRIFVADELKGTVDLVTDRDVKTGWLPSYIYISNRATVAIVVVLIIILLLVIRIKRAKKRAKKKLEAKRQRMILEEARRQLEIEEDRRRRGWTYHS